ncbi:MAG: M23 family metallopeptidase [bacterium]
MKKNLVSIFLFLIVFVSGCATSYGIYHKVKKGDTLYRLSRIYNVSVDKLKEENNIDNVKGLRVGDYLFVPGEKVPHVEEKESDLSQKRKVSEPLAKKPLPEKNRKKRVEKDVRFTWPLDGVITSPFGERKGAKHEGIDIGAPEGTPVYSAGSGKVLYSGKREGYGNVIIIQHPGKWITVYAHNSRNIAKQGQKVKKGDKIALVGQTGRASGPHLHFEVRKGIKPVNPLNYLPAAP